MDFPAVMGTSTIYWESIHREPELSGALLTNWSYKPINEMQERVARNLLTFL